MPNWDDAYAEPPQIRWFPISLVDDCGNGAGSVEMENRFFPFVSLSHNVGAMLFIEPIKKGF